VKQKTLNQMPEVTSTLEKMGETSRSMVTSMSDIVWAINPQNDSMTKMIQRMQSYAIELCNLRNVELKTDLAELITLKPGLEQRRNIYLVFKEALNNALKYSNCNQVNLIFRQSGNGFTMIVSDDGRGFNGDQELKGNGLQNMKRRAEEIGGEMKITTAPGKGTAVELYVKIT
jgi:signal transduction histidine kinase